MLQSCLEARGVSAAQENKFREGTHLPMALLEEKELGKEGRKEKEGWEEGIWDSERLSSRTVKEKIHNSYIHKCHHVGL